MNQREANLIMGLIIEGLFAIAILLTKDSPLLFIKIPLMACFILFSYGLFIYFPIALSRDRKEDVDACPK